ncbi:ribonuclease HII [Acutalibacter intestini]|uniref:ribonuclease HII n=1 Tax=Acutalibacter intestini TaxID=3093659 RepID=UPI002AC8D452|nr:ribonuclease HII [Acutalibacter sp. M00204]
MDWYLHQKKAMESGYQLICGVDEAGRGPLAGPVCAAAVILPVDCEIEGLNDSKKLSEKRREALFEMIIEKAISYGIGWSDQEEIDQVNILQATFLAMSRAVSQLSPAAEFALIDGNRMPFLNIPGEAIVKGDGQCACIAAASILAKVSRDRLLIEMDRQYPEYGFAQHKGYGTKTHYAAIKRYGILPVHRRSFLKKMDSK